MTGLKYLGIFCLINILSILVIIELLPQFVIFTLAPIISTVLIFVVYRIAFKAGRASSALQSSFELDNRLSDGLYHAVTDAIVIFDISGEIQTINAAAEDLFGYTSSDLLGVQIATLLASQHRKTYTAAFNAHVQSLQDQTLQNIEVEHSPPLEAPLEMEGRRNDGSYFTIEISQLVLNSKKGNKGEKQYFAIVLRDITLRKHEENRTSRRHDLVRAKLAISQALTAASNLSDRLVRTMAALSSMALQGNDRAVGICLYDMPESEFLHFECQGSFDQTTALAQMQTWRASNPEIRKVVTSLSTVHLVPIFNNTGRNNKLLGCLYVNSKPSTQDSAELESLLRDLADMVSAAVIQDRAHELLKRAMLAANQNDQLKSQFISTISHEIRTPLNGILGMLSLLLKSELNPKQHDQVTLAHGSSKSLKRLIDDLLDLSNLESGDIEISAQSFDLSELLTRLTFEMGPRAAEKQLKFNVDLRPDPCPMVVGDQQQLYKVLLQLTENAIKFTQSGEVTIDTSLAEIGDSHYRLNVSIKDTGIGIPKSKLDKLFSKFIQGDGSSTRSYGGTGIGLSICKHTTELMGGNISVTSTPGVGSQFEFYILLQSTQQPEAQVSGRAISG